MKQIAGAKRVGNLYSLSEVLEKDEASLNMEDTKLKNLEKAILWHRQLGHASSLTLSEMKGKNLLKGL